MTGFLQVSSTPSSKYGGFLHVSSQLTYDWYTEDSSSAGTMPATPKAGSPTPPSVAHVDNVKINGVALNLSASYSVITTLDTVDTLGFSMLRYNPAKRLGQTVFGSVVDHLKNRPLGASTATLTVNTALDFTDKTAVAGFKAAFASDVAQQLAILASESHI